MNRNWREEKTLYKFVHQMDNSIIVDFISEQETKIT